MSRSAIIRAVHRFLRILSLALITAGAVVLIDVAATLAWKEPVSSLYGAYQQRQASDELDALTNSFPTARGPSQSALRNEAERLAGRFEGELERGNGIGRIRIPAIGASHVLVEGTNTGALQAGPGRYPSTGLPGQGKTVGVAGHRTTYLAPFRKINQLEKGDEVIVEMPYARFTYSVERARVVEPHQFGVVRDVGRERIVLTACHPLYSAAQRYVVFADLAQVEPPSA